MQTPQFVISLSLAWGHSFCMWKGVKDHVSVIGAYIQAKVPMGLHGTSVYLLLWLSFLSSTLKFRGISLSIKPSVLLF